MGSFINFSILLSNIPTENFAIQLFFQENQQMAIRKKESVENCDNTKMCFTFSYQVRFNIGIRMEYGVFAQIKKKCILEKLQMALSSNFQKRLHILFSACES